MIRLGWFCPVSAKTGIATYSAQVLEAIKAQYPADRIEVIVFHPPCTGKRIAVPYPAIALSDELLCSDFAALFDVAVYHLGNNSLHHAPIYRALMRHPGLVVLHDHVYQHYLAGESLRGDHVNGSYVTLNETVAPGSFRLLKASGMMRSDHGRVAFVPWESEWATRNTLAAPFADMALGTVVHSAYARAGIDGTAAGASGAGAAGGADRTTGTAGPATDSDAIGSTIDSGAIGSTIDARPAARDPEDIETLFMPRPEIAVPPLPASGGGRIRLACCGHIGTTKGLNLLLNAFLKTPALQPLFHVVIAGFASDKVYLDSLRKIIAEARLGGVIDIRVDPSGAEYGEVMAGCDVFYNLRYPNTEGASLSLMEQLAHGRPVIAYRTGSFAEMPEAACYFLDRIGDDGALAELLLGIAADRAGLAAKGRAARDAVADKTATAYAARFVVHVERRLPVLRRRMALAGARRHGTLPDLGADPGNALSGALPASDRRWFSAFLRARRLMADFRDNRLLLPAGFAAMSPREKGDFVLANHLDTNVDATTAEAVGAALDRLSAIELHDVFGKLLVIAGTATGSTAHVLARELDPVALPITDLRVWRIIGLLPAPLAAFLAVHALGTPLTAIDQKALSAAVEQFGFKAAIRNFLHQGDVCVRAGLTGTRLEAHFSAVPPDEIEALPRIPAGQDVLALARAAWPAPRIVAEKFHAIEEIGLWSSAERAAIHVHLAPAAAQHIGGVVGFLQTRPAERCRVRLDVEERATGRLAHKVVTVDRATPLAGRWDLALPGFGGALKITFEVDGLDSPAQSGLSGDTRELGVLVGALVFDGAPAEADPAHDPDPAAPLAATDAADPAPPPGAAPDDGPAHAGNIAPPGIPAEGAPDPRARPGDEPDDAPDGDPKSGPGSSRTATGAPDGEHAEDTPAPGAPPASN